MVLQDIEQSRREFDPTDMVVIGRELAAFAAAPSSTGWVYDLAASRYRNLHSGEFMTQEQMVQLRNDFVGARGAAVQQLAEQLIDGTLSLAEWQAAMEAEIKLDLAVEYAFGAGGILAMNEDDWTALEQLAKVQEGFLERFAQAIHDQQVTINQLIHRASMYVDAGVQAFERGQAAANELDLPVYPGEDCDGFTACRCYWSFDEQDDGTVAASWIAVGDSGTCAPCARHADEYGPLIVGPDAPEPDEFDAEAGASDAAALFALRILERNAGVESSKFGWVTIKGNPVLIGGDPVSTSLSAHGYPSTNAKEFLEDTAAVPGRPQLGDTGALLTRDGVFHNIGNHTHARVIGVVRKDPAVAAVATGPTDNFGLVHIAATPNSEISVSLYAKPSHSQMAAISELHLREPQRSLFFDIYTPGHATPLGGGGPDGLAMLKNTVNQHFNTNFGWVTINGEHILISDVKTGSYSVGITSDEFHAAKIGDKAHSFELQHALGTLKATDVELSIGRGGWKSDEGKLFEENALALSFKDGSPEAVSREMATLGGKWGQLSALVQHYVRSGGEPQATVDMGRRLSDAEVTDVADNLKDHFGGWTFAVDPASGSTKLVISNVKAWGGPPDAEFKTQVHAVADALNQGGLDTSVGWRQVENIPLDNLSSAKLSTDGQAWRRDQGSSGSAEDAGLPSAGTEETGSAGPRSGPVSRDVPAGLEESILARLSEAEQLRQTLQGSVEFGWVTIDGHPVLIGSPEEVASATATIARLRNPATGFVVGAPPSAQTVQGLLELRSRVGALAVAGASQKNWYIDSSKAILAAAQGDKADAEKLAQLVAIYSPNTSPTVDMNDALDAWYQWKAGEPIKVGMGSRDQTASDLLYKGAEWDGRKTNNFYRNLMVGIDSDVANKLGAEVGQSGVTADIWMMRAFNYTAPEGAHTEDGQPRPFKNMPSPRQYDFIQNEVNLTAKQQGWTPEQTQAAIWSATKAKSEGTNVDATGYNFADALAARTGLVSGATTEAFRDPQGRDMLARSFGLMGGDNTFALPQAPQSSAGRDIPKNVGRVQEDARDAISAYTAARSLLLKQPTATWTRVFTTTTLRAANATVLDAGRPLTASETSALNTAIGAELGRTNAHTTVPTETGAWILNTTQPPGKAPRSNAVSNPDFQKALTSAVSKLTVDTTTAPARYDGQSFVNNWTRSPNGETYLAAIQQSGQADNFGAVASSLAARIAESQGTTPGRTAGFGWVTIGGNHVLIGSEDGAGVSALRSHTAPSVGSTANIPALAEQQTALKQVIGPHATVDFTGMNPKATIGVVDGLTAMARDYPQAMLRLSHVGTPATAVQAADLGKASKWGTPIANMAPGDGQDGWDKLSISLGWGFGEGNGVGQLGTVDRWMTKLAGPHAAAASVATHEFGHVIEVDLQSKAHTDDSLRTFQKQFLTPAKMAGISRYATKNRQEAFAEVFVNYYYGGSTHPSAVAMGKLLTQAYGSAPQAKAAFANGPFEFGSTQIATYPSAGFGWVTIDGRHILIGADGAILQGGSHLGGGSGHLDGGSGKSGNSAGSPLDQHAVDSYLIQGFKMHRLPDYPILAANAEAAVGVAAVAPALKWAQEPRRDPDNIATEAAAYRVFGQGDLKRLSSLPPNPVREKVMRDTYEAVQKALADANITRLHVFRGVSYSADSVPGSLASLKPGQSTSVFLNTAPLTSFATTNAAAAEYTSKFGLQGGGRFLIEADIQASTVFGTPRQGWGSPSSHEVVLLGGERSYQVTRLVEPAAALSRDGSQGEFRDEVPNIDDLDQNADWIRVTEGIVKPASFGSGPFEFGSTQINLPADLVDKIVAYQKTIEPVDLADGGLEDQPHITTLYGLL